MTERNLTHVGIGPAAGELAGVVYLELRSEGFCWNVPVTLDDLREIHEVSGGALPVWQGVKDASAVVNALAGDPSQ